MTASWRSRWLVVGDTGNRGRLLGVRASHPELTSFVAVGTARHVVRVVTTFAALNSEHVELAPEPVYANVSWVSTYRIDSFSISAVDKLAVFEEFSWRLFDADGIDCVVGWFAGSQRGVILRL